MLSVNQIFSSVFLLTVMGINLPAIPKLISEFSFYRSNGWDFSKESSTKVFLQDSLSEKFSFLPIGVVKLLTLTTQIWFVCAPLLAEWHGYQARH